MTLFIPLRLAADPHVARRLASGCARLDLRIDNAPDGAGFLIGGRPTNLGRLADDWRLSAAVDGHPVGPLGRRICREVAYLLGEPEAAP